uniref:DUF7032 domain-containing protein n=1 Tax=Kalanchoe fedtschenkoi TaxID=63787 RepID=A0A7N0UXM8_KALFE
MMVERRVEEPEARMKSESAEAWLQRARELVPVALVKAKEVKCFPGRWKMIISKLEQITSRVSDLSSHPFFSKNPLCKEQLQAVVKTVNDVILSGELCAGERHEGKLRMQSDLDALIGNLDLNLRDCGLLIKTGVLGEATVSVTESSSSSSGSDSSASCNVRELLARLQIGHFESKHKALDRLVEVLYEDEKALLAVLGRSNIAALVQLLTATSPRIREKAVVIISSVVESGTYGNWLVSEGVLPPLIRLLESGSPVGREKALISLKKLSTVAETAREIVGHSGVRPLVEICGTDDSVSQTLSAGALKNLSAVPEVRQELADEGLVRAMIDLLDFGILPRAKESAAECLQNLTCNGDGLKSLVIAEGGFGSLLAYIDGPSPQEPAVSALRNLVDLVSTEALVSQGFLSRAAHVLKSGLVGAKQAAASAICRASASPEMKKLVGEAGCFPLLVNLLEAKPHGAREAAAQAISVLIALPHNGREFKKIAKCVPNLVHLLDPTPQNTAKKYAAASLLILSSGKECRRQMIANGAIGYLKKLTEMDIPGSKKLLEALERGSFRSLFRSHSMRL